MLLCKETLKSLTALLGWCNEWSVNVGQTSDIRLLLEHLNLPRYSLHSCFQTFKNIFAADIDGGVECGTWCGIRAPEGELDRWQVSALRFYPSCSLNSDYFHPVYALLSLTSARVLQNEKFDGHGVSIQSF